MKILLTRVFLGLPVVLFPFSGRSQVLLKSPSGKIKIIVDSAAGKLAYQVVSGNDTILKSSGIAWQIGCDTLGIRVESLSPGKRSLKQERYSCWGANSEVNSRYRAMDIRVEEKDQKYFDLQLRVYDSGVAFRYHAISDQSVEVNDFTTFQFPDSLDCWMQDKTDTYEGIYEKYRTGELEAGQRIGPPMTVKYKENLYAALTEGNLVNFGGMGLTVVQPAGLSSVLADKTFLNGEINTPWRIIMIGSLHDLVNNTIVKDVSAPLSPVFDGRTDWIQTGNCVWSWLAGYDVTFENMKLFTDWASQLEILYNLVDEGWSHWNGGGEAAWEKLAELTDYAQQKGVKTLVWKAYPDRNGVEGIQTRERRRSFFKRCKDLGVAGVKIDYFDSEGQEITRYYEETLSDAAEFGLIVNYHGSNKPTGLDRTYPNELSREGIRGLEYGQSDASHDAILPFTRFLAGHGDYTPIALQSKWMGNTTESHQMASSVIFSSPLRCLGGRPEDYLQHSAYPLFIHVPTTWDETCVLSPSEPGECVLMARRKGSIWYLAGFTVKERNLNIPLSFLGKGLYKADYICDGVDGKSSVGESQLQRKDNYIAHLKDGGGFMVRFVPE